MFYVVLFAPLVCAVAGGRKSLGLTCGVDLVSAPILRLASHPSIPSSPPDPCMNHVPCFPNLSPVFVLVAFPFPLGRVATPGPVIATCDVHRCNTVQYSTAKWDGGIIGIAALLV
jgi:hypothetical protein